MKHFYRVFIFFISPILLYSQTNIIKDGNRYYFADQIIIKLKSEGNSLSKSTNQLLQKFNIESFEKTFHTTDKNTTAKELQKIITLKFSSLYNPIYIAKKISELSEVEWAEPHYLYEIVFEPNDPKFIDGTLKHLERIKAKEAWDINKGSENIIIAIVDTGVDWDHPDLASNIWINPNEIADDGLDNDNNGFIDDTRGWDFGGSSGIADNDPNEDKSDHGTHVAGISASVTNNGIGIASIGYNSKIMAVKTSQNNLRSDNGNALIAYGYNGIVYAANNGAKIINCSWGGYSYSIASQEVINYAISKGAIVVAAAGNDNKSNLFYPASYKGVLSVAATNSTDDQRASFSNYGINIDVAAPGVNIYSSWFNDSYDYKTGTSMASPLTAGLAALVANEFPDYTPLQIAEQIRTNTDYIDNINQGFEYKIGSGRINAFKALNNKNSKSVRVNNVTFTDVINGNGIYESGDEITIELNFTNYLAVTSNLTITLESNSSNITIIDGTANYGAIPSLGTFNNSNNKFKIKINDNAPSNLDENLLVKFFDGENIGYDWITININPDYRTQHSGNLQLTIASNGSIGFGDFPNNLKGDGLVFKEGNNVLFEGALMYGTSKDTVVNTARDLKGGTPDRDFIVQTPFTLSIPGGFADEEGFTIFNENNNINNGLGILTKLRTYGFNNSPNEDYIILNYSFYNTTNKIIKNFYAGLFCDFDLGNKANNDLVTYDLTNNFGLTYDNEPNSISPNFALAIVNNERYNFYPINNPISIYDGFSDEEKWNTLSSGVSNSFSDSSDISIVIGSGPFEIPIGKSITIAFVIAASDSLNELKNIIAQSRAKYIEIPTSINEKKEEILRDFKLYQNYPNPFNPTTTIQYTIPTVGQLGKLSNNVQLKVYDILGNEITTLVNSKKQSGNYTVNFNAEDLSSGVYYYQLKTDNFITTRKMLLIK